MAVLDLDGDHHVDLVLRAGGAAVARVFYGPIAPGALSAADADLTLTGVQGGEVGVGDLNGDGRDDLVLRGGTGNVLYVVHGRGR